MSASIPVNIIAGALGAGKTTAIARLLADKPADEAWVVILNEFTDTGIDTLTLAAAARGAYDVRMIPGGCLCCTGEEDFRRQLSSLLARPANERPARILIEPSGIARPGTIVDELRGFEYSGALRLSSIVALIEAHHADNLSALPDIAREQVDAADVVLLSKAELADELQREHFTTWAAELFPAKRYVGFCERGLLPIAALSPPVRAFSFEPFKLKEPGLAVALATDSTCLHSQRGAKEAEISQQTRLVCIANAQARARTQCWLERNACGWLVPAQVIFAAPRVEAAFRDTSLLSKAERIKAVLRTGIDRWQLFQRWGTEWAVIDSAWHHDSRIEVQLPRGIAGEWESWDGLWQSLVE